LKNDQEEVKDAKDNGNAHDEPDRNPLSLVDAYPHKENSNGDFQNRGTCYISKLAEEPPLIHVRNDVKKMQ
jgi:hypothetical protein